MGPYDNTKCIFFLIIVLGVKEGLDNHVKSKSLMSDVLQMSTVLNLLIFYTKQSLFKMFKDIFMTKKCFLEKPFVCTDR